MMAGSPVSATAAEAMMPASPWHMTPPTSDPRRRAPGLYPEVSCVSDESWDSFPLQHDAASSTSRPVSMGHDLMSLEMVNNSKRMRAWTVRPGLTSHR